MFVRPLTAVAGATALLLASCDAVDLPVEQTVDGPTFEYTLPAGETDLRYELTRTAPVTDVAAQLRVAGIDNFVLDEVNVASVAVELAYPTPAGSDGAAPLYLGDVAELALAVSDATAPAVRIAAFSGTSEAGVTAADLTVAGDVDLLSYLDAEELVGTAAITLAEPLTLAAPVTVKLTARYTVKARVTGGDGGAAE